MSIVNLVVDSDRVLIGVDTAASFMECSPGLMSDVDKRGRQSCKVFLHPQINTALTGRGDALLAAFVQLNLHLGTMQSFDQAAAVMPDVLRHAYDSAVAARKSANSGASMPGSEIILVGYSPAMRRFAAKRWIRRSDDSAFTSLGVGDALYLPEVERIAPVERPDTPAKMETLARRQVEYGRNVCPEYEFGGGLLLTELTRDGITVRRIATLE